MALSSAASAQAAGDDATRAVARELGAEGIEAYQANDYAGAEDKLDRAYRLFSTPTLGLWSARAHLKQGHWVEAAERYRDAMRASPAVGDKASQKQAQLDADQELATLLARMPSLTVRVEGAEPSETIVTLDGVPLHRDLIGLARPTNPGVHTLVAKWGSQRVEQSVPLAENERKNVPLTFLAAERTFAHAQPAPVSSPGAAPTSTREPNELTPVQPEAPSSALEPVAIVALSLGAASLVTWGVSAKVADDKLDKCPEVNGTHWCATESDAGPYRTAKAIATVSMYAGVALSLGGLAAWLLSTSEDEASGDAHTTLRWGVGPDGISVAGAF